jgi:hypothetical protein
MEEQQREEKDKCRGSNILGSQMSHLPINIKVHTLLEWPQRLQLL